MLDCFRLHVQTTVLLSIPFPPRTIPSHSARSNVCSYIYCGQLGQLVVSRPGPRSTPYLFQPIKKLAYIFGLELSGEIRISDELP